MTPMQSFHGDKGFSCKVTVIVHRDQVEEDLIISDKSLVVTLKDHTCKICLIYLPLYTVQYYEKQAMGVRHQTITKL
jgi:Zn-finger protein